MPDVSDDPRGGAKDKHLEDIVAATEGKIASAETDEEQPPEVEENPDVEDPRLFSPLQEADRPSTEQRIQHAAESRGGEVEEKESERQPGGDG